MKLQELKNKIQEYQYFEDTTVIDVAVASIISTRLKLGDPLWLVIIGASSGGKSQILRPISMSDEKFIHQVDDLTENTLLSGMRAGKGENPSLLHKIGSHGIMVISDLTVLFSKSAETRGTILSQFRLLYDGKMTKHSGAMSKALEWKGYLGVLAGSTPSIYSLFEEVADMGERFVYFRMKDFDPIKATHLAMNRVKFGKDLDLELGDAYDEYIREICKGYDGEEIVLGDDLKNNIADIAEFAERIRTIAHIDKYTKEITRKPVPAMPMRVALQLISLAKALKLMGVEDILSTIQWVAYSLANEEKRFILKILASVDFNDSISTTTMSDRIGLEHSIVQTILQNLAATNVLVRTADNNGHRWSFKLERDYNIVRNIEKLEIIEKIENRDSNVDDGDELERIAEEAWQELN